MARRIIACLTLVCLMAAAPMAFAGYRSEIYRATKKGKLFSPMTWDAKVIWRATFFSDGFRRAYENKHIKIEYLEGLDADNFISEQEYRQANGWDFFITIYTKSAYKKFSSEPDSFWKAFITSESGEVIYPESIEMIPISPYEEVMYPYINRWSKAYRVTFPKAELGKKFQLTLRSVVGESTLRWKLKTDSRKKGTIHM